MKHQMLAADMLPTFEFGDPSARLQKFLSLRDGAFRNFVNSLLLYDRVVIPTQDFLGAIVLANVLGENGLLNCLSNNSLQFARIKGTLAFAGSGGFVHGPVALQIPKGGINAESHPYSMTSEEALDWAYKGLAENTQSKFVKSAVMKSLTKFDMIDLLKASNNMTKEDINTSSLADKFAFADVKAGLIEGIEPEHIRIFDSARPVNEFDDVDLVLEISSANIEMTLADHLHCDGISTIAPITEIFEAKQERLRRAQDLKHFYDFAEITDIPDLAQSILEKKIHIDDVLKLRESRDGKQFRQWFHENSFQNQKEVARAYIQVLDKGGLLDAPRTRSLRFFFTTALGLVEPVTGLIASAADNFILPSIFDRKPVKVFVDKLKQLGDRKTIDKS